MRQRVVVRLLVDVPDDVAGRGGRQDEETAARRYVSELLARLPAGLLADFEVMRIEKARPEKAPWSE